MRLDSKDSPTEQAKKPEPELGVSEIKEAMTRLSAPGDWKHLEAAIPLSSISQRPLSSPY
jgi:hypothetical protein